MLAIKTDAMDVEDEKLVPTLSIAPSEYSPKRDSIRCFPAEDRHLILLETSRGAFDAESALRLLKIRNKTVRELDFHTLYRYYKARMKLAERLEDNEKERRALIRAHNFICRHLKEVNRQEYEEARVAREAAYHRRVDEYTLQGMTPGMEDPQDPVVPAYPVMLQGDHGAEIPCQVLCHAAMLLHVESVERK